MSLDYDSSDEHSRDVNHASAGRKRRGTYVERWLRILQVRCEPRMLRSIRNR